MKTLKEWFIYFFLLWIYGDDVLSRKNFSQRVNLIKIIIQKNFFQYDKLIRTAKSTIDAAPIFQWPILSPIKPAYTNPYLWVHLQSTKEVFIDGSARGENRTKVEIQSYGRTAKPNIWWDELRSKHRQTSIERKTRMGRNVTWHRKPVRREYNQGKSRILKAISS